MIIKFSVTFVIILFCQQIYGQKIGRDHAPFMEPANEEPVYRFYFDSFYYLNEKNCQYVQIVRTSSFDYEEQQFDGRFVDHDTHGRKLLEGHYENSVKEGEFTAYHTSGNIKWTGQYRDDIPIGAWSYFYPDGKPMLNFQILENGLYIQDYFDTRGRQRVKNGRGHYEMKIEIEPFNDYGADYLQKSGRIRNGKPVGYWNVFLVYEDGRQEFLTTDNYRDGRIWLSDLEGQEEAWGDAVSTILPINWFVNAENLSFKHCNIDSQSGYLNYLIQQLTTNLRGVWKPTLQEQWVEFQVEVRADGLSKRVKVVHPHEDNDLNRRLELTIKAVPYWIPSFFENEFIDDTLTVRILVGHLPDTEDAAVYNINIQREKGI